MITNTEDGNIVQICAECSDKMKAAFQASFDEQLVSMCVYHGDGEHVVYIKSTFGEDIEHMWVKVDAIDIDNKTIYGILSNEPVTDCGLQYGDPVQVSFSEIEDIHVEEI